jgi:LPS O-antigen subunit length determinant protein (WzzB/FepE family)
MSFAEHRPWQLIDWAHLLRRQMVIVLGTTLLCGAAATGFAFLRSPTYISQAMLEIGRMPLDSGKRRLEDPRALTVRLGAKYRIGQRTGGGGAHLVSAQSELDAKHIVVLKTAGPTAEGANQMLSQVVSELLQEHRQRYEALRGDQQQFLAELRAHGADLQAQSEQIARASRAGASSAWAEAVPLILGQIAAAQASLLDAEHTLRLALSDAVSFPTQVIAAPTLPDRPAGPHPQVYAVLGLVLGVGLSFPAALAADSLGRTRQAHARHGPPPT